MGWEELEEVTRLTLDLTKLPPVTAVPMVHLSCVVRWGVLMCHDGTPPGQPQFQRPILLGNYIQLLSQLLICLHSLLTDHDLCWGTCQWYMRSWCDSILTTSFQGWRERYDLTLFTWTSTTGASCRWFSRVLLGVKYCWKTIKRVHMIGHMTNLTDWDLLLAYWHLPMLTY